jgi:hypothetical protein
MNKHQDRQTLLYRHLKERCHNATADLYQWKALRIRQRQEIDKIGQLLVSLLDWARMKQEIALLGLQQKTQLNLLKVCHSDELALPKYSLE